MRYSYSLAGSHGMKRKFKISAVNVVAGQPVIWLSGGTGTITDPASTTDLTDAMGVTLEAGTASTTQGTGADSANVEVEVTFEPLSVFRAKVSAGATVDTNYAVGDGYLLTADTASSGGVAVIDALVGGSTTEAVDGFVFGLTGANAKQSRVIVTHTATTQLLNTIPFDSAIAVGDTFLFSQYAPGVQGLAMTSDFTQADGTIAGATGGEATIVWAGVSTDQAGYSASVPLLEVDFTMNNHAFNIGD